MADLRRELSTVEASCLSLAIEKNDLQKQIDKLKSQLEGQKSDSAISNEDPSAFATTLKIAQDDNRKLKDELEKWVICKLELVNFWTEL